MTVSKEICVSKANSMLLITPVDEVVSSAWKWESDKQAEGNQASSNWKEKDVKKKWVGLENGRLETTAMNQDKGLLPFDRCRPLIVSRRQRQH